MLFLVWQLLKLLISQIYELETNMKDERSLHVMRKWYFELTLLQSQETEIILFPVHIFPCSVSTVDDLALSFAVLIKVSVPVLCL